MIRFHCCGCQKVLSAADDQAGKAGRCPRCQTKFLIPGTPIEIEIVEAPPPPPKATRKLPAVLDYGKPAPSAKAEFEVDTTPLGLAREEYRPPPRKPKAFRDPDFEEEFLPKSKKKKQGMTVGGIDPFIFIIGGVLALGILFLVIGRAVPAAAYGAMIVGIIASLVGGIWFLAVAFSDGPMHGVLCLMCGFYALFYFISNLAETWKPFLLQVLGTIIMYAAMAVGAAAGLK